MVVFIYYDSVIMSTIVSLLIAFFLYLQFQAAIWHCLNHYAYPDAIFLAERLCAEGNNIFFSHFNIKKFLFTRLTHNSYILQWIQKKHYFFWQLVIIVLEESGKLMPYFLKKHLVQHNVGFFWLNAVTIWKSK